MSQPQFLFFLLFQLHYAQRSFLFPLLMKGNSRMPLAIMAMGIVFNLLNGVMQAGGRFFYPVDTAYVEGVAYLGAGPGVAVLTAAPAAWVFVWWTFANLVPRAHAIHCHYREEFGNEQVGRRKAIIPFIY